MKQERDQVRAKLEEDRDEWRRMALQNMGLVERVVNRASLSGGGSPDGRKPA